MKNLWVLLFIARVAIPMGITEKYRVEKIDWMMSSDQSYCLILEDGRKVFTPRMFTVIEEVK